MSAWWWMLSALVGVVITAFVVTTWLLAIASHAKPGTDRANSRLDAVRTGLAAGAGAGAAVGLMLAFRRQHHQEIATDLSDRDATERRITELYTKAVEQLGSDKAPVRLGGLYALERLAQDNPAHRQTIVNVVCAYLRMPFSPTMPTGRPEPRTIEEEAMAVALGATWQQERQVRLTAQRILAEHLRDRVIDDEGPTDLPSSGFWPNIRLDLAGATLIDFDVGYGVVADADFRAATFSGDANFGGATFSGRPEFEGATFSGDAAFIGTTFSSGAQFQEAAFSGDAMFDMATFGGSAWFGWATFSGRAVFEWATFNTVNVSFGNATFSGRAVFERATFSRDGKLHFKGSCVLSPSAEHVWPTGWCLGPDGRGGYTVVRANDDGRS